MGASRSGLRLSSCLTTAEPHLTFATLSLPPQFPFQHSPHITPLLPPPADPVNELKQIRALHNESYPCVKTGTACLRYEITSDSADLKWWTLAAKLDTNPVELLRSNPQLDSLVLAPGQVLFVPPCINGGELLEVPDKSLRCDVCDQRLGCWSFTFAGA